LDRITKGIGRAKERGRLDYQKPSITDFGSIGGYTFDNPGKGDKGTCGKDPMFDEPSCPS
jgi:hypothetical protein